MGVSHRLRILVCFLFLATTTLPAQAPVSTGGRPGLLAVNAATPTELREWDARINQMVRARQFVALSSYPDPDIGGRTHETLAQYYQNIPVYGGSLSRQSAQGVSVSIIGNVFENISIDSAAALSANQIALRLAESTGARLVGDAPQLVIFPNLDGAYRLAYRATMSDLKTYIVDAATGSVLLTIDEIQTQTQIGTGTGALGDAKKMSTTQVAGGFRAHDQLRPAPIRTFDTRGSELALNRLLVPPGAPVEGDYSVDADNTWADPPVVDTHVHAGWMQDYLFKQVSWTGIDNRRGTITSAVHTGLINNAFFIAPPFGADGGGMFVYGRTTGGTPMTTLDVVAHEMMHGVTNASLVQRTGMGLLGALFIDRFGPTAVTVGGSSLSCDSASVTIAGRQLPMLCNAGRFVLVSNYPGAINEGFSDIFGIAAEFFHQPAGTGSMQADYKLGEDLAGLGAARAADAPASMVAMPSSLGTIPYPDHASRAFSFMAAIAVGTTSNPIAITPVPWVLVGDQVAVVPSADAGGVHLNSTILSHAFYLAIEGGRNATSGLTVQGVGAANRAQIERAFFRAMTVIMPNVPSMRIAALATFQAAVDLYGANSTAAVAIRQAMQAVGLMN
ncbi:MAG TPA: M4 family metallopeptidase [Vicinamibacterales bacterium]|nr:M4 family metallopeptidase [Vicinamibacterales bacterium]